MEAVLLHSGYHSVPRRKMLWELKQDCHNNLVADNIRRDKMDAMLQCLHFRDNAKIDDDGYFKVRPTGWQRYIRNTFKASLSYKKSTFLLISFTLKCLSSLQKRKQKQTDTFWQK